ncbi:phosphatase PAP2 family protein [Tenacibaculum agarivorans]|uniref:phosphatase PAP2 family protein n=1 Tax=Tenacibaculum agarivorans TaxID=1908389 RepID=UPI00117D0C9E|nr:phosphatase PAP2 family protein [Tenacibaculum agarivorans]
MLSIILLSLYDKKQLHLELNQYHNGFFDAFFKYTTFLGDGILFGVFIVLFFFIKRRMALVFAISGVLTLLLTHLFKKIIFRGLPRPIELIGADQLHLIEGVKMAHWNTFPSGHTTTAFAIFTILILYNYRNRIQYLWILLAIIAGVSRVYLSQHFWIDIFVGSVLGILIAFISMSFYNERKLSNE